MSKRLVLLVVALVIAAFWCAPTLLDKLFDFVFVGLVPFTNYTIPPDFMLGGYALLLSLGIYYFGKQIATVASPTKRDIASRTKAREKVRSLSKRHVTAPKKTASHSKKYQPATEL